MFCVVQQDRDVDDHLVAVEGMADPNCLRGIRNPDSMMSIRGCTNSTGVESPYSDVAVKIVD